MFFPLPTASLRSTKYPGLFLSVMQAVISRALLFAAVLGAGCEARHLSRIGTAVGTGKIDDSNFINGIRNGVSDGEGASSIPVGDIFRVEVEATRKPRRHWGLPRLPLRRSNAATLGQAGLSFLDVQRPWKFSQSIAVVATELGALNKQCGSLISLRGGEIVDDDDDDDDDENKLQEDDDEVEEQDVVENEDNDESDEEEEEEEDERESGSSIGLTQKKKPLRMRSDTPVDKLLDVVQALGGILGKQHDSLSSIPALEFFLSNPMFIQMGVIFLMMKFTKKIDYNDNITIFRIRLWYTVSMTFIQFMFYMVRHSICRLDEQTLVVQKNPLVDGLLNATGAQSALSGLGSIGEMAAAMTGDVSSKKDGASIGGIAGFMSSLTTGKKTTVRDYDLALAKRRAYSQFPSMAIMYFMHFKKQWHKAVVFAPVGPLMQALTDPLFQIHILGRSAEGPLSRPFKSQQQRMMEDMSLRKDEEEDETSDAVKVEVIDENENEGDVDDDDESDVGNMDDDNEDDEGDEDESDGDEGDEGSLGY